jgi:hypothetical protein
MSKNKGGREVRKPKQPKRPKIADAGPMNLRVEQATKKKK